MSIFTGILLILLANVTELTHNSSARIVRYFEPVSLS